MVRLAFYETEDGRFLVVVHAPREASVVDGRDVALVPFDDENVFLHLLILADLGLLRTTLIAINVLLSVAEPVVPHRWLHVQLTPGEQSLLCLA